MYLEGNEITQIPADLFVRLPNLKWIDLRNNKITEIPNHGLTKNNSLRYLLLSGNLIQTLPAQLGKIDFIYVYHFVKLHFDQCIYIYIYIYIYIECNKIIAPCTLYTKKGIFYFCNRSNRLIYMYVR